MFAADHELSLAEAQGANPEEGGVGDQGLRASDASGPGEEKGIRNPFESFLPRKEDLPKPVAVPGVKKRDEDGPVPAEKAIFDFSSLRVTGLVWGDEKAKAIINDRVIGIGDAVNGGVVTSISREGIVFNFKGRDYLMRREGVQVSEDEVGRKEVPGPESGGGPSDTPPKKVSVEGPDPDVSPAQFTRTKR